MREEEGLGGERKKGEDTQLPKSLVGDRPLPYAQPSARPSVGIALMRTAAVPCHVGGEGADLWGRGGGGAVVSTGMPRGWRGSGPERR